MSASEQSTMSVREYKLVNRSESAVLASRVQEAVRFFAALLATAVPRVECALSALAAGDVARLRHYEWRVAQRGEERLLGIGLHADSACELARLMLGDAQGVALDVEGLGAVREIGMAMTQDFGAALLAALDAPPTADRLHWQRGAVPSFGGAGEAAMIAECIVGERLRLAIMLWPTTVLSCLARTRAPRSNEGPLEPLRGAIKSGTVRLEVLAGEAEMAVSELATLKPGDVIKLNHKLERPLAVRLHEGEAIGTGYLGTRHGRPAVRWATGR
jgi:hypothetical protein